MIRYLLIAAGVLIFLINIGMPSEIIDELQLIHAIGYDSEEDGKIRGTATFPLFNPDGTVKIEKFTSTSYTSRYFMSKINTQSPKPLTTGQLRIVLFENTFAQKGVLEIVNTLYRDPNVGNTIHLAVVEGKTSELLRENFVAHPMPSIYMTELIDQNIETENLPKTNLHVFLYNYYGKGMDPYLPLLKKGNGKVKLMGLALFKEDKYIAKLNHSESFVFKMLVGGSKSGRYEVKVTNGKQDGYGVIRNIHSKTKYHVTTENGKPKFNIQASILGEIHEYPHWLNLEQKSNINLIERAFKKDIEKQAKDMIAKFQKLRIDPLGLGDQVRRRERGWAFEEYKKQYQNMEIKVSAKIEIVQTGIIE
ncbi:Ger(x)C family spore germination protein [Fictibacillus iocasae]|uniref:Ger(X)C family spore germination protein n=1 Tax=Fictibacillus iocasae TaxID=2715437 RepID=A0ABW2NKH5_9BACL